MSQPHAYCQYRRTFHSDQGWGYQMKQYSTLLVKYILER